MKNWNDAEHPLTQLFNQLVLDVFDASLRLRDQELLDYLRDLLVKFTHMENVYGLTDINGKPLTEVVDMLHYADIRLGAQSFYQEREVHRHIGDYTLFWTGLFPESIHKLQSKLRKDFLLDYVQQGKQSYYIVSLFDIGEWRAEAPLFRRLSENFEVCRHGLYAVRQEWERRSKETFDRWQ
ncbi:MAG: hypothetical protein HUU60_11110 [Armatimonadetes bacterium]|nr:hypothetical protein [Armatimonadota bacterium]